jgi:hypothetical protein
MYQKVLLQRVLVDVHLAANTANKITLLSVYLLVVQQSCFTTHSLTAYIAFDSIFTVVQLPVYG